MTDDEMFRRMEAELYARRGEPDPDGEGALQRVTDLLWHAKARDWEALKRQAREISVLPLLAESVIVLLGSGIIAAERGQPVWPGSPDQ